MYSNRCGRVRLHNVAVVNQGLDFDHPQNTFWAHKVRGLLAATRTRLSCSPLARQHPPTRSCAGCSHPALGAGPWAGPVRLPQGRLELTGLLQVHRREATCIILHRQSEFEASDVVLQGNHMFEVRQTCQSLIEHAWSSLWTATCACTPSCQACCACAAGRSQQRQDSCCGTCLAGWACLHGAGTAQQRLARVQVPDGYRMLVRPGPGRSLRRLLHPLPRRQPTWEWQYSLADSGQVNLDLREPTVVPTTLPFGLGAQAEPLSWVI